MSGKFLQKKYPTTYPDNYGYRCSVTILLFDTDKPLHVVLKRVWNGNTSEFFEINLPRGTSVACSIAVQKICVYFLETGYEFKDITEEIENNIIMELL